MGKNKQKKFAEVKTFPNVFQVFNQMEPVLEDNTGKKVDLRGNWRNLYFKNDHPIIVELACGKGDYTISLAKKYPEKNFIGIDIKGARIWTGAKHAVEEQLENVAFIRVRIENILTIFDMDEIDEIWITFPDPFPNKVNRRLTAPKFLKLYNQILKPEGKVHLKTDDDDLFRYTLEVAEEEKHQLVQQINNVYEKENRPTILDIKTFYEKQHLANGRTIKYVAFKLMY